MQYRQLATTDIYLSAITFGAWAYGKWETGGLEPDQLERALHQAIQSGATSIDTAPCYGLGGSEEVVGKVLKEWPRDKVQVLTKCGVSWEGNKGLLWLKDLDYGDRRVNWYKYSGKESIIRECENSLRRLGTDYIDVYSVHYRDPTTPVEESMEALLRLKEQGKIRASGVSNFTTSEMRAAERITDVVSNKVPYSMLHRYIEEDLVPYCLQNQKSILAYSVLQRGILTGWDLPVFTWGEGLDDPRIMALYEAENLKKIRDFQKKITPIAGDYGISLTQLCINWTLARPGITVALLGATRPDQILYDLRSLDIEINQSDILLINTYLSELEKALMIPAVKASVEKTIV